MPPSANCLFCRIIAGEIPATLAHQDAHVVAFEDISPKAPVHVLVCPRKHLATLNDVAESDETALGHIVRVAARIAADRGVAERGYRLVANCQAGAGQSVFHVHFHLLAGRPLGWPPG